MKSVAVIGASLAGLSAARALRDQGFDGELTIVGGEALRPYDRPPLSKEFLAGTVGENDLQPENHIRNPPIARHPVADPAFVDHGANDHRRPVGTKIRKH